MGRVALKARLNGNGIWVNEKELNGYVHINHAIKKPAQ
jgi:hypothetical protein